MNYPTLSYSSLSYSTLSYSTLSYSTLSYSTLSYFTLSYSTVSYSTLSYSTLSYLIVVILKLRNSELWHPNFLCFRVFRTGFGWACCGCSDVRTGLSFDARLFDCMILLLYNVYNIILIYYIHVTDLCTCMS